MDKPQVDNARKAKTGKSAVGLVVIAIMIVIIIAAITYVLMQPGVLESVISIVTIVAVVAVALVIIGYVAMAIMAIPMYAYKGEQYQEGVDYNLDDVKSVEGKDDKNEER